MICFLSCSSSCFISLELACGCSFTADAVKVMRHSVLWSWKWVTVDIFLSISTFLVPEEIRSKECAILL